MHGVAVHVERLETLRHKYSRFDRGTRRDEGCPLTVLHTHLFGELRRDLREHLRLKLGEVRKPAAHAARRVVLGEAVRREHVWVHLLQRLTVTGRGEVLFARHDHASRLVLLRVHDVRQLRFHGLVVSRDRAIDHALRCEQPALTVGLHDERVIAGKRRGATHGRIGACLRVEAHGEVGDVVTDPLLLVFVPPDPCLLRAPRLALGVRGSAVVKDLAVGRPHPAPFPFGVGAAIGGLAHRRMVDAVGIHTGVDPAATGGGTVSLHIDELRKGLALVLTLGVIPVDLANHSFGIDLAVFIERVVPRHVKHGPIARIVRILEGFANTVAEIEEELQLAFGIARRRDRLVAPLHHALRLRERTGLLSVVRGGHEEHFGVDVFGLQLARFDLGTVLPERGRFDHVEVANDKPLEVAQRLAVQATVRAPDRGVLAEHEVAVHLVLEHELQGLVGTVRTGESRQVVEVEVVLLSRGLAPPRLEKACGEFLRLRPEALLLLCAHRIKVGLPRVRHASLRHRKVAGEDVEEGRDVGRALNVGVPAKRENARTGAAHVAHEQLENRGCADELRAACVLGPAHGVAERGRLVATRVLHNRLGDVREVFLAHATNLLHNLGGVALEVALEDLEDGTRVLQGFVANGEVLLLVHFVLPARRVVRASLGIEAREEAIEILGILIVLTDERRSVRVVLHVLLEEQVVLEDVVDESTEQNDVAACAGRNVLIGKRRGAREARVDVDHTCAAKLRFNNPLESDRVTLGHVGALDDDAVRIREVLHRLRGSAAPKRGSQTGNRGAVSYAGLVLDLNSTRGGKQLLDEVVFLVIDGRATERSDTERAAHGAAVFVGILPVLLARLEVALGNHRHSGLAIKLDPLFRLWSAVEDVGHAPGSVDELLARGTLRAQAATRDWRVGVALDLDDLVVFDVHALAAANGAVGAHALNDLVGGCRTRLEVLIGGRLGGGAEPQHIARLGLPQHRPIKRI